LRFTPLMFEWQNSLYNNMRFFCLL
jgi:hypothetical protein